MSAEWEWKYEGRQVNKNLSSRPTLDTALDTPGPRYDHEGPVPTEEVTLRAVGVRMDDEEFQPVLAAARNRGQILTVTDKLEQAWTGKLTSYSDRNEDGTDTFEVRITIRLEQE